MLNEFIGKSIFIEEIGDIYPINVIDYEKFQDIAYKYIVPDKIFWEEQYGQTLDVSLFEIILINIAQLESIKGENPQIGEPLKDFCFLLELSLKKKVTVDFDLMIVSIESDITETFEINKDNFGKFRESVLYQNLLFPPKREEDPILQAIIDNLREEKIMNGENHKIDLEAILQVLTIEIGIKPWEWINFTYYQVWVLYMRLQHIEGYDWTKKIKTSGFGSGNIVTPKLDEKIDVHKHPDDNLISFDSEVNAYQEKL